MRSKFEARNSGASSSAMPEPQRHAPSYSPMSTVVNTKPEQSPRAVYSDYDHVPHSTGRADHRDLVPDYAPGSYVPPPRRVSVEALHPPQRSSVTPPSRSQEVPLTEYTPSPGVMTVEEWERRVAEKEKNQRLGHGSFTDSELAQRGIRVTEKVSDREVNQRVSQHTTEAIREHEMKKSPSASPYTPVETRSHNTHQLSDQELQGLKDSHTRQPHVLGSPASTTSYQQPAHGQGGERKLGQPLSIVDRDPILQQVLERGRQQRSIESKMPAYHDEEPSSASHAYQAAPTYGLEDEYQHQTLSSHHTRAPLPPPSGGRGGDTFGDSHGAYSSMASSFDSITLQAQQQQHELKESYKMMWDQRDSRQQYQPPSLGADYRHDDRRRVVGSQQHMHGVPGTLGLGFKQSGTSSPIRVAGLQEGLPAALDGRIRVGDVLTKINHHPIPYDLHSVVQKLQGDIGESVRLTLDRPDLSPAGMYDVTLVRMPFPDKPPQETALSRAQAAAQRAREEKDKGNLCRMCLPIM